MPDSDLYQHNVRKDALKFLADHNLSILNTALEVGGGAGFTLESLKHRYDIASCLNIDLELPESRAQSIDHICADILNPELKLPHSSFDLILALDVLEHIHSLPLALSRLHDLASDNAFFLFSLPNIQHYSLFTNVYIRNTFPKESSGIFDETHVHWLTLRDFQNLIASSGLNICACTYTDHRCITTSRSFLFPVARFISPQYLVLAQKNAT